MGEPRTAKARLKNLADIAPDLLCCEGIRASVIKNAAVIMEVILGNGERTLKQCKHCKAEREVTVLPLSKIMGNFGSVAAEFIDIDEGG